MMDPTVATPWVSLLLGIVSLATAVWAIISKPGAKAQADVADLSKKIDQSVGIQNAKIDKVEDRVVRLEADIEHLPDRDMTHRLEMAIARLDGRMETMDARLEPIAAISRRLQDLVMEGKVR